MEYLIKFIKNYFNFNGRASKKEFRIFMGIILVIILGGLAASIYLEGNGVIFFGSIIFVLIPSYAVSVRRLHDAGQSGVMVFTRKGRSLSLFFIEGDSQANQYGEVPID